MIRGEKVLLRARAEADVPLLYAELQNDVETRSRADSRPWTPEPVERSRYAGEPSPKDAAFCVVEPVPAGPDHPDGERLAGEAMLWGIDTHNRGAHIGISLFPSARGRGLGTDVVRVLCHYAFVVRGLRRVQIETVPDNLGMLTAAARCGFTEEGRLRSAAWVYGQFTDVVMLGLLAEEWPAGPHAR